jgi:RecA/RadA recombinase
MAKTPPAQTEKPEQTASAQATAYLQSTKDDHYNFEPDNYYKVPSSSLNLTLELTGGLCTGAHRFIGITAGGKTSCALDFMLNFLRGHGKNKGDNFGVYFRCEGRLSPEVQSRSGVPFTLNPTDWKPGTCLIVDTNVYEVVFGFIRELITKNEKGNKYFFVIDSVDSMARREDLSKPLEEADKVAGGALITSVFLKKTAVALAKRGHIIVFISQVREEIKLNQYQVTTPRQGKSSGGHAIEHGASCVLDFLPRNSDDVLRLDPSDRNSKAVGHHCKVRIVKSDNENYNKLTYPIKYGRTGGASVWREAELVNMMIMWEHLKRKGEKGSWFTVEEKLHKSLQEVCPDVPDKFQGIDNVRAFLEENPKVCQFLYEKYVNVLSGVK